VDWAEAAKDVYSKQWACTAIDLAIKANLRSPNSQSTFPAGLERRKGQVHKASERKNRNSIQVHERPKNEKATSKITIDEMYI